MPQLPQYGDYIKKVPVQALVQTSKQLLIGYIHLQPGFRVKDVLNRGDEQFIAMTQVSLFGREEKLKFLLLHRQEIVWIAPVEETD